MHARSLRRKAVVVEADCVACGCCVKICPVRAIAVVAGCYARVDEQRCVGCGRCAAECPATVIEMREVRK